MNKIIMSLIGMAFLPLVFSLTEVYAEEPIPDWVRHVTSLWARDEISDLEYFDLLENLLEENVISAGYDSTNVTIEDYNYQGAFQRPSLNQKEMITLTWEKPKDLKADVAQTFVTIIQPDKKVHRVTTYGNVLHFELNHNSPLGVYVIEGQNAGQSFSIPSFEVVEQIIEHKTPPWVKNTAKWWAEGQMPDDYFRRALHYLISNDIVQFDERLEKRIEQKVAESDRALEFLKLTQDEVDTIQENPFWEIVKIDQASSHNATGVVDSMSIVLKDKTMIYNPTSDKFTIPSILIEVYEFENSDHSRQFWTTENEDDLTLFDIMEIKGSSTITGDCFFNNSGEGAISACSYDNVVIQAMINDPKNYFFDYKNQDSDLEKEPTVKILNFILNKINSNKGITQEATVQNILEKNTIEEEEEAPQKQKLEDVLNNENIKTAKQKTDPEKSLIAGIEKFSCQRDEFGLITISGLYVNDSIERSQVVISLNLIDYNGNIIDSDQGNFYDIKQFESREFLVHTKWLGDFSHCEIDFELNPIQ